jgi:hypothetical protein
MPGVRGGVKSVDLLATIRAEIGARLVELRAAVEEYEQLLSAADALERETRRTPAPTRVARGRVSAVAPRPPVVRKVRTSLKASGAAKTPAMPKAPVMRRMRITSKAAVLRKTSAPPKAKAASNARSAPSEALPALKPTPPKTLTAPKPALAKASPAPKPAPAKEPRPKKAPSTPAAPRVSRNESQQAITAALEHGSHTVAELAIVTAMSGPAIREAIRGLQKAGKVKKAKRGDGKAAYALAG